MVTVPEEFLQQIRQALINLGGKENIVVKFIAYSDNAPLEGRDERIYGDQLGAVEGGGPARCPRRSRRAEGLPMSPSKATARERCSRWPPTIQPRAGP